MGSVYIVVGCGFGTRCGGGDGVCRKIARASNARPYRVVVLYCPVGRGDPTPPRKLAIDAKQQGGVKTPPYE